MHSVMVISGGLILLLAAVFLGRAIGGTAASVALAVKVFLPVWLAIALVNLWVGVSRAGYTVAQELPFLLLVFGVPAAAAALVWWKFGQP
jgi:hypothetical protein